MGLSREETNRRSRGRYWSDWRKRNAADRAERNRKIISMRRRGIIFSEIARKVGICKDTARMVWVKHVGVQKAKEYAERNRHEGWPELTLTEREFHKLIPRFDRPLSTKNVVMSID